MKNIAVNVTASENVKLMDYRKANSTISAIRVSLVDEGISTPFLGLSLDEEKPQDESFCIQGVTFIVDKILLKQCGGINIDFIDSGNRSGFKVTSTNPLLAACAC